MYVDLIFNTLSTNSREALEMTMNSIGYEYQSDFARRYVAQGRAEGKAEGRAEGRAEAILEVLEFRFGPLTDATQTSVRGAQDVQLDRVIERMMTAQTLQEALDPLS